MTLTLVLALVAAGVGAGLFGSVAGLASVVSYPALLALGLDPVQANITNTLGLVALTGSSVLSSQPELKGNKRLLLRWAPVCVAGGLVGAGLLLLGSSDSFEKVAPLLIIGSAVVVLLRPWLMARRNESMARRGIDEHDLHQPWWLVPALFAVSVYVGYFGAAAGVLVLAVLVVTVEPVTKRAMALRAGILGIGNAVAGVWFAFSGRAEWRYLPALLVGMAIGGWLGPKINRRLPDTTLRLGVAAVGLVVGLQLLYRAYLG